MTVTENISIALSAIRANLLRTVLTFMIIAFGIMALVGILTSIDSIKASLTNNFASMGSNTFNIIRKGSGMKGGRHGRKHNVGDKISFQEAVDFKDLYNYPAMVSVSALGTTGATVKYKKEETNPNVIVYGADENYLKVAGYELAAGRAFTSAEASNGRNIAMIGHTLLEKLFPNKSEQAILGQTISIRNIHFTIVGILKEKGSTMSFTGDRMVMVPVMSLRKYFGSQTNSYNLSVAVYDPIEIDMAIAEAEGTLRQVRNIPLGKEADFEIEKSDGLITFLVENTATIQLAAIFIGVVTLLGAAIGLMNIMLVSVTERTREIGICKSLGATRRNILLQFLTEAIVICQLGGLLGIILGILVGNIVTFALGGAFIVPWAWMALGITLCFVVGLMSGLYPALKASALDPIESLRYE